MDIILKQNTTRVQPVSQPTVKDAPRCDQGFAQISHLILKQFSKHSFGKQPLKFCPKYGILPHNLNNNRMTAVIG